MQDNRDLNVIEHEINRLVTGMKDLKHKLDEQSMHDLLKNQSHDQDKCCDRPFDQSSNYFKEFWKYYIFNEISISKINEINEFNSKMEDDLNRLEVLHQEFKGVMAHKHRKKNRRCAQQIPKAYQCPYDSCSKIYGSDVALNLHVKLKHEGGNKTERERLAREIVQSQLKGEDVPHNNLQFPPGYLESLKKQMLLENTFFVN